MAVNLSPVGGVAAQFFTSTGAVLTGGKLYTYAAGTTTPATTYTTFQGDVPWSNPIVLDAAGRVPNGGEIWLTVGVSYKFVLKDSADVLIGTYDNVPSVVNSDASLVTYTPAGTGAVTTTVQAKLRQTVSVKDFGAVGDGLTNDTTAIQNALNSGAGAVYAPSGTYLISSVQPASNQLIYGDGAATIFKQKAGANFVRPFLINSKTFVTLDNFAIDGNGNSQAAGEQNHGVFIVDSTDINVYNLIVHDCQGDAVGIYSSTSAVLAKRIRVENCTIYNLGRCGFVISGYGASYVDVTGILCYQGTRVTTSTSGGNSIHLELDSAPSGFIGNITIANNNVDTPITSSGNFSNLIVDGNTINVVGGVVSFGAITLISPVKTVISDNTIIVNGYDSIVGVYIQDATGNVTNNISVTGNSISGTTDGIYVYSTASGVNASVSISSNTLFGCSGIGVTVLATVYNTVIDGNTMRQVTGGGIKVGGTNGILVSNNAMYNIGSSIGIWFSPQGAAASNGALVIGNAVGNAVVGTSIGIQLDDTSLVSNIKIIGNDFSNTNTPMSLGTNPTAISHLDNIVGTGTLTGSFTLSAAATTTITNANVYSGCRVILTPTNAAAATLMGSAKCLYVSAKTQGTSFAVTTASGAAAAGTETFDYQISN